MKGNIKYMRQALLPHMCAHTLRRQVVAAVDASVDDIEAGHWQQHFCVPCQVAQVLVQGGLFRCSSSLPTENINQQCTQRSQAG